MVGLIKDRVAQLLGKKVVMLAGRLESNKETLGFAQGSIQRIFFTKHRPLRKGWF